MDQRTSWRLSGDNPEHGASGSSSVAATSASSGTVAASWFTMPDCPMTDPMTRPGDEWRDLSGPAVMEKLVDGMLAFRAALGVEGPPSKEALAAVWSWANRTAKSGDEIEQACLMNVLDDQMWVDWQEGQIVFRVTPAGMAHVEEMAGGSDRESIEALMMQKGLHVPPVEARSES